MPPPTGVVSGPLMATWNCRMASSVPSGSQSLNFWYAFSPAKTSYQATAACRHRPARRPRRTPSGARQMSGPVPSPSIKGMIGLVGDLDVLGTSVGTGSIVVALHTPPEPDQRAGVETRMCIGPSLAGLQCGQSASTGIGQLSLIGLKLFSRPQLYQFQPARAIPPDDGPPDDFAMGEYDYIAITESPERRGRRQAASLAVCGAPREACQNVDAFAHFRLRSSARPCGGKTALVTAVYTRKERHQKA